MPIASARADLVVHQRDQRRDDQRRPVAGQRRQLVAERLARRRSASPPACAGRPAPGRRPLPARRGSGRSRRRVSGSRAGRPFHFSIGGPSSAGEARRCALRSRAKATRRLRRPPPERVPLPGGTTGRRRVRPSAAAPRACRVRRLGRRRERRCGRHPTTVDSRCAMMIVVRLRAMRSSVSWIACSVRLSSALVASSRTRIGGFLSRVRAMATRCFSPPDSLRPRSPTMRFIAVRKRRHEVVDRRALGRRLRPHPGDAPSRP